MQETKHTELCEKQWLPAGRTFPTDKVQANKTGDLVPYERAHWPAQVVLTLLVQQRHSIVLLQAGIMC